MHVVFVAAEAWPWAKVGGLGDVVGSLPAALAELGVRTTTILPWYAGLEGVDVQEHEFHWAGETAVAHVGRVEDADNPVLLIGLPELSRPRLYGYEDDDYRFLRFARAAAAVARSLVPDVVHVHDWQAALVPIIASSEQWSTPTVCTVHNLAYQGTYEPDAFFRWTGLPPDLFHMEALEFYGQVNVLKGGIVFADRVTTVSPSYAKEIQTAVHGHGLDGVLRAHAHKLHGILNGIDVTLWDPRHDEHIDTPFDAASLVGKAACTAALAGELSIEPPILGIVSRLVWHKGLDLVLECLDDVLEHGYSIALLGSGEPERENNWRAAQETHPGRVAVRVRHDEALAHRIFAGSAGVLVPSRQEPCGLTQMIGMRYGALPVAHAVGGLADSIQDGETGFLFGAHDATAFRDALERFAHDPARAAHVAAAMARDASWSASAAEYRALYESVT